MRTIDADPIQDQYIAKMEEIIKSTTTPNISLEALSLLCGYALIMDAPTIEQCKYWDNESNFCGLYRPAATKHGWWIWDKENDKMFCSECGYETDNWGVHQESDPIEWQVPNYCENCGAKMDEVE